MIAELQLWFAIISNLVPWCKWEIQMSVTISFDVIYKYCIKTLIFPDVPLGIQCISILL